MIDTAEQTTTTCLACGRTITQKPGRGHRQRLYCDDRCRQRAYREEKEREASTRIAALEKEIASLQERLDIETRFRTDTAVRHLKNWLHKQPPAQDSDFAKRFLADTRLPQHASRSLYMARMRLYKYSEEDIYLFEEAWKDMLFRDNRDKRLKESEGNHMAELDTDWLHRQAGRATQFEYQDRGQTITIDYTTILGQVRDTDVWIVRIDGHATDRRGEYWWDVTKHLAISRKPDGTPVVDNATDEQIGMLEDEIEVDGEDEEEQA